jgi:hypothetical protein
MNHLDFGVEIAADTALEYGLMIVRVHLPDLAWQAVAQVPTSRHVLSSHEIHMWDIRDTGGREELPEIIGPN